MSKSPNPLLSEIEAFISRTGMGESYFGKKSVGNSELISRLRANRRVWPDTAERVRAFIKANIGDHPSSHGPAKPAVQAAPRRKGAA